MLMRTQEAIRCRAAIGQHLRGRIGQRRRYHREIERHRTRGEEIEQRNNIFIRPADIVVAEEDGDGPPGLVEPPDQRGQPVTRFIRLHRHAPPGPGLI
jgi:hypothetical protein